MAIPSNTMAGVDVKNSNCVPISSISTIPDLTDSAMRNGGRKTRNPDAAAKLIPMNAAIARVKPSMILGCGLPVLMQARTKLGS